jgi:hypothetical protein
VSHPIRTLEIVRSEQAFGKLIDNEHLFVLEYRESEQVFGEGVAMSVAWELEYEPLYPRLRALPAMPRPAGVSAQVKRRRLLFGAAVVVLLVMLMLPIRAFGGKPVASTVPTAGQEYIVQQGDTLTSIASQVDRTDASSLVQRLAAEVGSNVVVPGEHLLIP